VAFPRLEYLTNLCPLQIVAEWWERGTFTNIGHMSVSPPTVGKCERSQRNFWSRTELSLYSHSSLILDKHKNDACEGSFTIVKHTSRYFVLCPFMLLTPNTDTWHREAIILTYSDITCHVFILFCGIAEIHKILGLRECMEEDHTAANLVNAKRSSENFVPYNQNKHRVVIKKTEILYKIHLNI